MPTGSPRFERLALQAAKEGERDGIDHLISAGIRAVWIAAPNQAWFVMFGDSLLRIFSDKADADAYIDDLTRRRDPMD